MGFPVLHGQEHLDIPSAVTASGDRALQAEQELSESCQAASGVETSAWRFMMLAVSGLACSDSYFLLDAALLPEEDSRRIKLARESRQRPRRKAFWLQCEHLTINFQILACST